MCEPCWRGALALVLLVVLGCGQVVETTAGTAAAHGWDAEARAWLEGYWAAVRSDGSRVAAYLSADVVDDRRALDGTLTATRWDTVGAAARRCGAACDELWPDAPYLDLAGALVAASEDGPAPDRPGSATVLLLDVGPDGIERITHHRAASGSSQAAEPDETAARAIVDSYLATWADPDPATVAQVYASEAVLQDTLRGVSLVGQGAIVRWAQEHPTTVLVDTARDHHTPQAITDVDAPALYVHRAHAGTYLPVQQVVVLGRTDDAAGQTALVLTLDDTGRVVAERRLHRGQGVATPDPPAGPWWAGRTLPLPVGERPTRPLATAWGEVAVRNGSAATDRLLQQSIARFARAGLAGVRLTTVTLNPYDDRCSDVQGHVCLTQGGADVLVCLDETTVPDGPVAPAGWSNVVLHELAHVWVAHHVDASTREAFLDAVGVPRWDDGSDPWQRRGTEWAAETITWGLLGYPTTRLNLGSPPCLLLHEAFQLLTGLQPVTPCEVDRPTRPALAAVAGPGTQAQAGARAAR